MNSGIRVLSLFDGMGCGRIALQELGIPVDAYYASEVDKFAIRQTKMNFPDVVHLGDVRGIEGTSLGHIDLILAGSPCQSLSFAGKRNGLSTVDKEEVITLERYLELKEQNFEFEGESYLFWEFVRLLHEVREINPNVYFLVENVEMGQKWENVFDSVLGLKGVHINSALVSAQNRRRIYWSNIRTCERGFFGDLYTDIPQPEDRGILFKDIMESNVDEKYYLSDKMLACLDVILSERNRTMRVIGPHDKTHCWTASVLKMNADTDYTRGVDGRLRVFTPIECARLQTIPDWYSWEGTSATQVKRMCGNGWTIEVIKHILSYLKDRIMIEEEFTESVGIMPKELEEVFKGRGEVKGFTFTQLDRSDHAYLYEQKDDEFGDINYEVFRRRVNVQFGCVSYPKSNGFGDSIYMGKTFRDLDKAKDYFAYLNKLAEEKACV